MFILVKAEGKPTIINISSIQKVTEIDDNKSKIHLANGNAVQLDCSVKCFFEQMTKPDEVSAELTKRTQELLDRINRNEQNWNNRHTSKS